MNINGLNSAFMSTIRRRDTPGTRVDGTFPDCHEVKKLPEETQQSGNSRILGLTMVWDRASSMTYGMSAQYAPNSTKENPIIEITSNQGGTNRTYRFPVKEIDPEHATQLEMFALCSYTDDVGITEGGAFGTFQKLKAYGNNAEMNGYCSEMSGWDNFLNMKFDWKGIVNYMAQQYAQAGIDRQCQEAKDLLGKLNAKDWMY